jgi:hypothetical protein
MYLPALYDRLAKSYNDVGQPDLARSILIAKQDAEYKHTDSVPWKALLYIWWLLSSYGYRAEFGMYWIAGMVLVGSFIFWTAGEKSIPAYHRPKSWMLFSLDSVLPVINLDRQ